MSSPMSPHAASNLGRPNNAYYAPSHPLRHEQRPLYAPNNHQWKAPLQDRICLRAPRPESHATTSRSASPALTMASTAPSTMDLGSQRDSSRRDSGSSYTTDFDDLYDISDEDDSAIVPLKCSNSMKQLLERTAIRRESLPSLVIPSPTAWPTIQKLRSATSPRSPMAPPKNCLSPAALARLNVMSLRVPTVNSTPSLDGSLTSDELASMSPATPDLRAKSPQDDWDAPMQLDPRAMDTLNHLSFGFSPDLGSIIEVPETQVSEMQERGLNISMAVSRPSDAQQQPPPSEPVSAISIPSPGGFMASLDLSSQKIWDVLQRAEQPSTTTAECFYDVPWDSHLRERVIEQVVAHEEIESEGPPTARQDDFTSKLQLQTAPTLEEQRQNEYDEEYDKKLSEAAASNMSRTSMWLHQQETYLSALKETNPLNAQEPRPSMEDRQSSTETISPPTPPRPHVAKPSPSTSTNTSTTTPSTSPPTTKPSSQSLKKSVRFIETTTKTPVTAIHAPRSDSLFYHAFQYLLQASHPSDAFGRRHIRADALQAQRLHLPDVHRAQLQGHYAISLPQEPKKDFAHLPDAPADPDVQRQREAVSQADRERQALSQISLAHWHLEAMRMLSAGSLLPRTARDCLASAQREGRTARILDLGGLPTADWGWAVSMEQRGAKVYTVVVAPDQPSLTSTSTSPTATVTEAMPWTSHRGPSNHRTLSTSQPWSLPFPDASFDVISARTLHSLCRTRAPPASTVSSSPKMGSEQLPFAADFNFGASQSKRSPKLNGSGVAGAGKEKEKERDGYELTLAELHRVLAPGGCLCYTLLDAEVSTPTSNSTSSSSSSTRQSSLQPPSTQKRTTSLAPPSTLLPPPPRQTQPQLDPNTLPLATLSQTFATTLRASGFDPTAGSTSHARLLTAGFASTDIKESWLELPVGGQAGLRLSRVGGVRGSDEIGDVCELVGGVAWERWMCAFEGKDGVLGLGLSKGVGEALEKARRASGRCAWRMRVGVAVKGVERVEERREEKRVEVTTWI